VGAFGDRMRVVHARRILARMLRRSLRRLRDLLRPSPPEPDVVSEVAYGMQVAEAYVGYLANFGIPVEGIDFLELGPAGALAPGLVLASLGARVTLVDRFPDRWRRPYRIAYLQELARAWQAKHGASLPVVEQSLAEGGIALRRVACPAEALTLPDTAFDVVFSNAVLEHVEDIEATCRELFRVTRPGGIHAHQIDLRDHHDFAQPLEFLLSEGPMVPGDDPYKGRYGNRRRFPTYERAILDAGFVIDAAHVGEHATDAYLATFLPRLRASSSPYRDWPEDDLRRLGVQFVVRRPAVQQPAR
jgi:SAM-dependent methyltransferase